MGDAQSAQRESENDAAAEEVSGQVDDAQSEQNIDDKPPVNNGQISEISGKADTSIAEVNGHCEDEIAAEAILSPDEDVLETEKALKEDELENVKINAKESPNEAHADEDVTLEITEIDAKQNDINAGFRRFFSNIGLKLTVKKGSGEIPTDVPDETNSEEPNRPEDVEDTAKETKSETAEQNTDVNTAQDTYDNDSTTCPTLTDVTSEDILENADEKTTETKEEVESDNADADTVSPVGEDAHQDVTPEEEPQSTSPSSPEEEVVISPIKRFFTTGIFSGLRKKKQPTEDETTEKELVYMVKNEVGETTKQTLQGQQQDKDEISQVVEAAAVETEYKDNELKEEIMSAASNQTMDEGKSPATVPSTIIVSEPEILNSQEKEKVQASPLKRLLSGSSLKKFSIKQRGSKSSDAKLSDAGEHVSDQRLSSTEPAENQKEDGPAQPSTEAAGEEDGAWASFKKLVTPKKHIKRSSLSNDETQIPGSVEEPKPSEGEQISDHSTEAGKKRKDSSVSWEAVLCGSGRRRSRKTSDSEDETPPVDDNKEDGGSKHETELQLESSNENENEILAGSPSGTDGGSTWKSLKKLVTPKRKAKDEDESKDNIQSDTEVSQDESSFSIKKLLPGRKKRKSAEKPDQMSSDEADKDVPSDDEDSETPAVVPLSEFDTVDTEVHIHTQADTESHIPEEADYEVQQDLLDQMAEPVPSCDILQTEAKTVEDNDDVLKKQATSTPIPNVEPEDLTEIISKHHQLSDIPEEGIITETMATPASVTEEAARDDTIAEDLIEITSEAITAPEPVDITLTDETEMVSAVSQLSSESSKTSGNTTPVPAEYDVKETDALLHHVIETISISPKAVPVCSDNQSSEIIVSCVSHQILETFVKEEPTFLEKHRSLDATVINTGCVEELDAVHVLAATAQTESISEVNDSVSTEIAFEIPTDKFDSAEMAVDVHEVNVTHPEECVKKSIDKSREEESLSGVFAAVSTDILPEGDRIVPDESSLVEAQGNETKPQSIYCQESDLAATVVDETKDGAMEQDVQTEKEDQIMHNITDPIQVEDKDQLPVEVEELKELAAVHVPTSDSKEGSQSLEKETVTHELEQKSIPITEVNVVPEREDEQEINAAETVQAPEELEAVQASTLDSEKVSVQSPEEEVKSEDIAPVETVSDEPQQKAEHLTEVSVEPENTELPVKAVKSDHVQEHCPITEVNVVPEKEDEQEINAAKTVQAPEELEAVQASTLDSEKIGVQSPEEEVKSEDIAPVETVSDEPQQKAEHLTEVSVEPENTELPVKAVKSDHVQEHCPITEVNVVPEKEDEQEINAAKTVQAPEELEAVQASTLDSEKVSVQSPEEEVKSEDIPPVETVSDEPQQKAEHLTEVSVEPENTELPVKAVKSDHVQEHCPITEVNVVPEKEDEQEINAAKTVQAPEELEAVQASTLDSEKVSVQSPEEEVKSEDIPPVETVSDEPQQKAEHLTEGSVEPENTELPMKAVKSDHVQEHCPITEVNVEPEKEEESEMNATKTVQTLEVLEAVQAPMLDSEEDSVQSPEKGVKSEDIPAVETVSDETKQETEVLVNQEEIKEKDVKTALPSDVKDIVTETKTEEGESMYVCEIPECIEEGNPQELENQIVSEDSPKPDADTVIASVTDETESKAVAQLDQALELTEGQKEESIPRDVRVEQENHIPEGRTELHTLTAVHLSSVNEEASNVQVLENIVFYKETSAPCVDNAAVTKPKHEVHHSTVQVNVEEETESELPGSEIKTAAVDYAVVAQVVTCNLKEVSVAIPDVLIEKTSHVHEPLIDRAVSEVVFKEENETATPLVRDDVPETTGEESVVMMMHVPSVELEDNHRIQVQVVNVDIKSAETIVDTVLEVGATEDKEVIDVCHETIKKVDNLSATPEIEEMIIIDENKVMIQEVIQHVKENLPEAVPKSMVVNLEQDVMKQPDVVTEVSELLESESNEVKDQKAMEDSIETFNERQDEAPAVISDDSAPKQQVSEDLMRTPDIPGSLKVSTHDHKEDLEATKAEPEKSEADVTAEEVKSSSEEVNVKKMNEQAQIIHIAQSQIVTPSDTGLVVPQNTGVISSIGNVESPSSLSLEFKLNIQFGQAKAPVSPPPTTIEITEPMKHTDMAEVGVQVVEAVEPAKTVNPTQRAESQKQKELTGVAVQAIEITEPAANFSTVSTERAVIKSRPILLNVGIEAVETVEQVEQITSTERVTSNVKAMETIQPVSKTEKREVFLGHPVLSEECDQEIKAEDPVKQTEEEGDQDVWMDAEEVIQIQEETQASLLEVEEPPEPHAESEQEEKAALEHEVEMVSNTEEEESQQDMQKMGGACQIESEGEHFAVALEHPEIVTASTTTMKLD